MKFKENDILYYVYPFPTLGAMIEKVQVSMCVVEMDGLYYIDQTGAYLKEEDLFHTLDQAKQNAFDKLNNFYSKKTKDLINTYDNDIKMGEL